MLHNRYSFPALLILINTNQSSPITTTNTYTLVFVLRFEEILNFRHDY